MSRFAHIALVALVPALCAATQARVIRSIPEARTLSHADFLSPLGFELHGRIIYVSNKHITANDHMIVLGDGDDRLMLHLPAHLTVKPGDTVTLRGQTEFHFDIYDWFRVDSIEMLGHEDPIPPKSATVGEILDGRHDLEVVTVRGIAAAIFKDEIDARWRYCVLRDGDQSIFLTADDDSDNPAWVRKITGATIEATGLCSDFHGLRRFIRPGVRVNHPDSIRIIESAPDPFDVPELENSPSMPFDSVMRLGRRKVCGLVLAAWSSDRILVKTTDGRIVRAKLALGERLPEPGTMIGIAGTVSTDLFRLNLTDCAIRTAPKGTPSVEPEPIVNEDRFSADMKNPKSKVSYLGKTIRIAGTVERTLHTGDSNARIDLDANGMKITTLIDPSRVPADVLEPGAVAEITGTFVTNGDNWRPDDTFPRVGEWAVVPRSAHDVRILKRAPWWTVERFMAIASLLIVALAASFAWIFALRHLANRRGRALFREQIARASAQLRVDERTRLAAELHDSLSQNLSGIACQISVAKLTAGESETRAVLSTAERMLQSCRTELTRCIGDLRDDTLEDPDFNSAIKRNLDKLALPATIRVRFTIPRARISDLTAHSILCIVRELVTNAVRHGGASTVKVAGGINEHAIVFSVRDNGSGFDVEHRPGVQDGHYGIEGIKDRVRRLAGTVEISSAPGKGTSARIFIPVSAHPKKESQAT